MRENPAQYRKISNIVSDENMGSVALYTVGNHAFSVSAARAWWNGLPEHVTSSPSLKAFEDSPLLQ